MRTGRRAGVRVDGRGPHREVGAGSDERIATHREKTSSAYNCRISKTRKRGYVAQEWGGLSLPDANPFSGQAKVSPTPNCSNLARRKGNEHVQANAILFRH